MRHLVTAAVLVAAIGGLSACEEHEVTRGENEGVYLDVGGLNYQVQISRPLNPFDTQDREYLTGLRPEQRTIPKDQEWFALFVRVMNEDKNDAHKMATRFAIEDTTGAEFHPVILDAARNPHAYSAGTVPPKSVYPAADTTAGASSTGGALLLFRMPGKSLENRPLEFKIIAPDASGEAIVDLDV